MSDEFVEGNFLGLPSSGEKGCEIVILSLPYELTTSYGQGTENGPAACIEASAQVELHDPLLSQELPAGRAIFTSPPWDGEGGTLAAQLEGIEKYLKQWFTGGVFPVVLGGEHGSLPAQMRALCEHPTLAGDLSRLTVVQIDAHADLRDHLEGEKFSHACAARRALDEGVGKLIQIAVRAYSKEEDEFIKSDDRVTTYFARDLMAQNREENAAENGDEKDSENGKKTAVKKGSKNGAKKGSENRDENCWQNLLSELAELSGPVWLTLDIDGLDGSLVPHTGTPVPGGLAFWQAVEIIEALFSAPAAEVIGADVVEIVPGTDSNLTQFTAAMLATKIVAAHIATL
jgi:agmatinase